MTRLVCSAMRLPACGAGWQRRGERGHAQLDGLQRLLQAVALGRQLGALPLMAGRRLPARSHAHQGRRSRPRRVGTTSMPSMCRICMVTCACACYCCLQLVGWWCMHARTHHAPQREPPSRERERVRTVCSSHAWPLAACSSLPATKRQPPCWRAQQSCSTQGCRELAERAKNGAFVSFQVLAASPARASQCRSVFPLDQGRHTFPAAQGARQHAPPAAPSPAALQPAAH